MTRISRKYHGPGPRRPSALRAYLRHLGKWLLIVLAVVLASQALVDVALARMTEPPASKCDELLTKYPTTHVHIRIKCKGNT